jgi:hypothetical protein
METQAGRTILAVALVALGWWPLTAPSHAQDRRNECFTVTVDGQQRVVCRPWRREYRRAPTRNGSASSSDVDATVTVPTTRPSPSPAPPHTRSSRTVAKANGASGLVPVRALIEPAEVPPKGVGAYGVVAFTALPMQQEVERHRAVCEAFKAVLIDRARLPKDTPLSSQMITFWPVSNKNSPDALRLDCAHLVAEYDLKTGLDAINDADLRSEGLAQRRGPYLVAWSPAASRYSKDKVVLLFDLSGLESRQSFQEVFQAYRQKIVSDPKLWRRGFEIADVRRQLRDALDRYGEGILRLIKL